MAKQDYKNGAGSGAVASLGQAFGISDDDWNLEIKTGDKATMKTKKRLVDATDSTMPAGVKSDKGSPIKVLVPAQEDYIDANGDMKSRDVSVPDGQEWNPTTAKLGEIVQGWASKAFSSDAKERDDFKKLQKRLYDGGFMKSKPTEGVPDENTMDALVSALKAAKNGSVILDEVLDNAVKANGPKQEKNAHSYQLTSPTDVRAAILANAPQLLGHGVSQDVIDQITAGYNSLEANSQQAQFAASDANNLNLNTNDNVATQAPTLANYAAEQLRAQDPGAAQGQQLGHFFSEFINMLHGGSTSSASLGGNIQSANG